MFAGDKHYVIFTKFRLPYLTNVLGSFFFNFSDYKLSTLIYQCKSVSLI